MRYCFDIDGTVCTNTWGEYESAVPDAGMINQVNALYDAGHHILMFTARGSGSGIDWRDVTERQLAEWGVRYHELRLGKPEADLYIDDRGMSLEEWAQKKPPEAAAATDCDDPAQGVMSRGDYLDITYSEERAPIGPYPGKLARHLFETYFGSKCGSLLDLGCGRGEYLQAFSALGMKTSGTDISPRSPALAAPHTVRVADLATDPLPYPRDSFDFLFSKSVVEHTRDPVALLKKGFDGLKPGGIAVIMTPSYMHTYWGPFYVDHTHVTPFTAPSLADAITFAGFEAVTVHHFHQLPFLWKRPLLKPLVQLVSALPIPFRPFHRAPWPESVNKFIRFSNEVMLLAVAKKPG